MAQTRYTAREDGRSAAQHHPHLLRQHLAAQQRRRGKAREHNIDVQFTNYQDSRKRVHIPSFDGGPEALICKIPSFTFILFRFVL
jgi:hypothetical protein